LAFGPPLSLHRIRTPFEGRGKTDGGYYGSAGGEYAYITRYSFRILLSTVFPTIPDDKKLVVEMFEKQGGRHQAFELENGDLVRAETVNELKVR
jgi:hypothetical protein